MPIILQKHWHKFLKDFKNQEKSLKKNNQSVKTQYIPGYLKQMRPFDTQIYLKKKENYFCILN